MILSDERKTFSDFGIGATCRYPPPVVRRSREHQPRGEAESTSREEKQRVSIKEYPAQDSIQPKIEGLVLINPFQVFLVLVVRTFGNKGMTTHHNSSLLVNEEKMKRYKKIHDI